MGTVLVTGGLGFIGSHIVDAALSRGWRVRIVDSLRADVHGEQASSTRRGQYLRADAVAAENLSVIIGDITDATVCDDALQGVDVVCHQAAKVGLGVDFADTPDYVHTNETGTATLLAAMASHGIGRLVIASSMVVYGEGSYRDAMGPARPLPRSIDDLENGRFDPISERTGEALVPELITEDAALDPRNVYAVTKLGQEQLASVWARATGGRAALLRYHNVYGPRMPKNTPYAGVASVFRSALARGEAPRVFEDGGQRRDFVHVRDVAEANLAAIQWTSKQVAGHCRAFNVGSGDVHTVHDLARALSREYGKIEPIVTGEYRLGDVRHITASSQRMRHEMGWRPLISFDAGMSELAHAPLRADGR